MQDSPAAQGTSPDFSRSIPVPVMQCAPVGRSGSAVHYQDELALPIVVVDIIELQLFPAEA